jgi:hypothetical protein
MKTKLVLIVMTIILIGCSGKSDKKKVEAKNNNSEFVEVYEEPRHQLVFENNNFKVLDIQIKPGDTTLFHRHRKPMFYVSLGWQKSAAQSLNEDWSQPTSKGLQKGEIVLNSSYLDQNLIHRVTNVGTKSSRLIGILNTSNGLKINNESNTNPLMNRWFRSKRIELYQNDTLDYQQLEFPTIIIIVSGDEIEVITDNKSSIYNKKWLQIQDMSQLYNSSNSKIEMIQIEVLN